MQDYQIQIIAKLVDDQPSIIIDNQIEDHDAAIAALLSLSAAISQRVKDHVLSTMLNSIIDSMPPQEARALRLKMLQNPKSRELMMESLWNLLKAQLS